MERYQKEMNEIHAPKELIEATKQKCRQAELSKNREIAKRKKGMTFWIPAACAAVLFLAAIPAFSLLNVREDANLNYDGMDLHLGSQDEQNEQAQNEKLIVKRTAIIPMQFAQEDVTEEIIDGKKAYFAVSQEGYYSVCIAEEEEYVVVDSRMKDKEEFIAAVKEIIK